MYCVKLIILKFMKKKLVTFINLEPMNHLFNQLILNH